MLKSLTVAYLGKGSCLSQRSQGIIVPKAQLLTSKGLRVLLGPNRGSKVPSRLVRALKTPLTDRLQS